VFRNGNDFRPVAAIWDGLGANYHTIATRRNTPISMSNTGFCCSKAMSKPVKHTILVADDDRVLAQLLWNRLTKTNYTVVVSYDAMHAFMAAMKLAPSAVILDINMPGGTGLEVLKRLKSSSKTSLIPVIVLSGSIDPADIQSVIDLGADEFLRKPPDFERLQGALDRLLPSVQ
jgi:CheY-like chemotaxis protein